MMEFDTDLKDRLLGVGWLILVGVWGKVRKLMKQEDDELLWAIRQFNEREQLKADQAEALASVEQLMEENRQGVLLRTIVSLNNSQLNGFLRQDNVQPLLDNIGVLRTTHKGVRGLVVRTFEVPRMGTNFGHALTLAYVAFSDSTLALHSVRDIDGSLLEVGNSQPIEGLVFAKEVGTIGWADQDGKRRREKKVEIILPEHFAREGIFETALAPGVTPDMVVGWTDERMVAFIQTLNKLS